MFVAIVPLVFFVLAEAAIPALKTGNVGAPPQQQIEPPTHQFEPLTQQIEHTPPEAHNKGDNQVYTSEYSLQFCSMKYCSLLTLHMWEQCCVLTKKCCAYVEYAKNTNSLIPRKKNQNGSFNLQLDKN
ncbi:unnamed protein product [Meganyctiphanes norvegica]|uniref:Uncharacterized protein n=1 Tax=Meganyctiphanes norvegica TaxID=48144 RepID=A0AAV2S969_MEGNR